MERVERKSIIRVAFVTAFILLLPLLVMQFTDEVVWTLGDFVVMGVILFGTGLTYEFMASRVSNLKYRTLLGIAIFIILFLIWAELAVGIFGTPWAGS